MPWKMGSLFFVIFDNFSRWSIPNVFSVVGNLQIMPKIWPKVKKIHAAVELAIFRLIPSTPKSDFGYIPNCDSSLVTSYMRIADPPEG